MEKATIEAKNSVIYLINAKIKTLEYSFNKEKEV